MLINTGHKHGAATHRGRGSQVAHHYLVYGPGASVDRDLDRADERSAFLAPDAAAIARGTSRAAVVAGPDNRILFWNPAAAELLGLAPEDAVGANLQEILDARDVFGNRICSGFCAFHEMVQRNEFPEWFELNVRTASGARLRVVVSVVVVRGPDARRYELIYVMTPVRRRRRADEAIDRLLANSGAFDLRGPDANAIRNGRSLQQLTQRQREVLERLARGQHPGKIASELGVSVHTVRSHVRLGVGSQLEAVAVAMRSRLV